MEDIENNDIQISTKISEQSWKFLKLNKILFLYPLLSIVINLSLFYFILISSEINFYLGAIILYYLSNFIGIFFNSVLVAYIKLSREGKHPTFFSALNVGIIKLDKIIYWALFQATVGYLLSILESNKFLKIFIIMAEVAWAFVTYFVVPIIIIEDKSVSDAVTDSKKLIKDYWTDGLKGEFILSIFVFIIFLVLLVSFVWVTNSSFQYAAKYVLIGGGVLLFISLIINSALIEIYHTLLYYYLKEE